MQSIIEPAARDSSPSGMIAMQLLRWIGPKSPELWFCAGVTR